MKAILRSIMTLLAAGAAQLALAQQEPADAARPDLPGQVPIHAARGTGTGSRLIAYSFSRYNLATSTFLLGDSVTYSYSNGRGGDMDVTQRYDQCVAMQKTGNNLANTYRYLQTFDASDNITSYIVQRWEPSNGGSWVNQSRYNYTYDPSGFRTRDTGHTWNMSTNTWIVNSSAVYTSNGAGKTASAVYFSWNSGTSQWDSASHYLYTYDANNNLLELVMRNRVAGVLKNNSRNVYTYNAMNKATSTVYQSWSSSNSWTNTSGFFFVVNSHGDRDVQYNLTWSNANNRWDSSGRNLYTFDANFRQTMTIYQTYVSAGNWKNRDQYLYTNNSFGQYTNINTKTWNAGGFWETTTGDVNQNYYYETYTTTSVPGLAANGGSLNVWPVPAVSALNVRLQWSEPQAFTARITDLSGRICRQWTAPAAGSYEEQLSTAALPAGAYILQIDGSKGGSQKTRFTVLK